MPVQVVKGIGEVEFHHHLNKSKSGIDGSLASAGYTDPQLAGWNRLFSWLVPKAHLEAKCLRLKPMAVGRIPADFLFSANIRPPTEQQILQQNLPEKTDSDSTTKRY